MRTASHFLDKEIQVREMGGFIMPVDQRLRHDRSLRERSVEMFERGLGYRFVARCSVETRNLSYDPSFSARAETERLAISAAERPPFSHPLRLGAGSVPARSSRGVGAAT